MIASRNACTVLALLWTLMQPYHCIGCCTDSLQDVGTTRGCPSRADTSFELTEEFCRTRCRTQRLGALHALRGACSLQLGVGRCVADTKSCSLVCHRDSAMMMWALINHLRLSSQPVIITLQICVFRIRYCATSQCHLQGCRNCFLGRRESSRARKMFQGELTVLLQQRAKYADGL